VPCLFGLLHGEYFMEEVDGEERRGSGRRGGSRLFESRLLVLEDCCRRLENALFEGGRGGGLEGETIICRLV